MAGLPDMQELSPLRPESAKQIAAILGRVAIGARRAAIDSIGLTERRKNRPIVLGFDAWHFQLSDGPILEEMSYG
jgi:hypothetical protein